MHRCVDQSFVSTIGLNLSNSVFQVHGADEGGCLFFINDCRCPRSGVLQLLALQPRCTVAMETYAGSLLSS
jgi:hypothetical protein